jgi:hypothetical protein
MVCWLRFTDRALNFSRMCGVKCDMSFVLIEGS